MLAFGSDRAAAAKNASQLLTALQARFGPHERDQRLDDLRPKFAKSALNPSPLFRDKSAWTASDGQTRTVVLAGSGAPNQYHLSVAGDTPPPLHTSDYRRVMVLSHLGRDDYAWAVRDELGVGTVTGNDLGNWLSALFRAAEQWKDGDPRSALRRDLPRTAAALGRAFTLDTMRLSPNVAGGTDIRITTTVAPGRIAAAFPRLAHYLSHYVTPTDVALTVFDDQGRTWWSAAKHGDAVSLVLRVHDGALAPLAGPLDRMPDRVHVRIEGSTHTFIFHVGLKDLVGDVTLTRTPNDKAFVATFHQQPDWQLPPLVEQMLRDPLQRPFQGSGARLSLAIHDGDGDRAPAVVVREYDLTVRESRIMRWFGDLGNSAIEDFRTGAEVDFDHFTGDALGALGADVAQLGR